MYVENWKIYQVAFPKVLPLYPQYINQIYENMITIFKLLFSETDISKLNLLKLVTVILSPSYRWLFSSEQIQHFHLLHLWKSLLSVKHVQHVRFYEFIKIKNIHNQICWIKHTWDSYGRKAMLISFRVFTSVMKNTNVKFLQSVQSRCC